jgi:muramidase (phage lysozyme)
MNELKTWLSHTLRQMAWAQANNHDKIMGSQLRRDAEMRRPKLKELNAIAASLRGQCVTAGQEIAVLNADWDDMERKIGLADAGCRFYETFSDF